MKIEILITADVIIEDDDDIAELKREVTKQVSENIKRFEGDKYGVYGSIGMYYYFENLDHEAAFDDEGSYEWRGR